MLTGMGHRCDVVSDGKSAVEALRGRPYDLVLMDCQMPEMDGFEAAAEIRRRETGSDRRVPIIALTANAIEGDREQCLAAGMDDYLPKPFTAEQMRAALAAWLHPTARA
jgi:CheY-like chemotaxis protein